MQKFVSDARGLLSEEFTRQLQNDYGLDPHSGTVTPVESLGHLDDTRRETARILRDTLAHYLASSPSGGAREALDRIVREQAFTILNRLAALRMAESRGILIESVGNGYQSKGFQLYERLAGPGLGETGDTYRCYLFSIFDEFALDLKVLFDRFSPQGRLFPRETALLDLLKLLNDPELAHLWAEDESIGWVYQYFNSKEERKKMRDESAAPRNSRELAVRNQFFTPRYVVEFLTDNTLGRIWYEMTQGETGLKESCRYLVRRPNEIFLKAGEKAPEQPGGDENLSQEELLIQPVHIQHRPLKDPRTLRMLDPACGSMHFGLYAFDLFEQIYDEAWEMELLGSKAFVHGDGLKPLTESYSDKGTFLKDVPRLIIEYNIHGIDIDPRATQIAGLSLWLRAQRSWHNQGVRPVDRPRITRSNIVCAEPMPGEKDLLREFTTRLEVPALGYLVEQVFDKMQLAGEAGSLLKIEEEIRDIIAEAKRLWKAGPKLTQMGLFGKAPAKPEQIDLPLDFNGITDERFWESAEGMLYQALQEYAEISGDHGYQRRLFTEDAARGFAFIDLCRKSFDVVLMNPPFGDPSKKSKAYIEEKYLGQPFELYADFVERFIPKCCSLGAITSHTFLTYGSLTDYRKCVLLPQTGMRLLADFGLGVMDAAMVRSAAYVLDMSQTGGEGIYFRLVEDEDKEISLRLCFQLLQDKKQDLRRFIADQSLFRKTDQCSYAYWAADTLLDWFDPENCIGEVAADILLGVVTSGNDQFLRLVWEIDPNSICNNGWAYYCKGGDFQKFFRAPHLVIDWRKNGAQISAGNSTAVRLRDPRQYFRPGLTFPLVNEFGINLSVLPGNCIFDNGSPSVFSKETECDLFLLGLLNSRIAEFFVRCLTSTRHWQVGYVRQVPWPSPTDLELQAVSGAATEAISLQRQLFLGDETLQDFCIPSLCGCEIEGSLNYIAQQKLFLHETILLDLIRCDHKIDELCFDIYRLTESQRELVKRIIGPHPLEINDFLAQSNKKQLDTSDDEESEGLRIHRVTLSKIENTAWKAGIKLEDVIAERRRDFSKLSEEVIELVSESLSYFLGITFGRWDISFSTGEKPVPALPDPFAPLPACPPGMLKSTKGLTAEPQDVPANYPVCISWLGILVDDEGHKEDIAARIRESIEVIWKEKADGREHEACEILGVRSLREYYSKPSGFFADHLKRYSKSRRQAPIYWPLSTSSGSYTLWIYYHRLNDQTLYTCVMDYVEPKLRDVAAELGSLRQKGSGRNRDEEKKLEKLQEFEIELQEFRDELLRLARLPWKPNLNDGVQITAAPLWKLFQLPKWKKTLKETWEKLEKGEYDWAHLAYSIWPDRVKKKCVTDKSLAIAHDLEDLYVEQPPASARKNRGKRVAIMEIDE